MGGGGGGAAPGRPKKKTSVTKPYIAVLKKDLLFRHIELSNQTRPKKSFTDVLDM